MRFIERVKAEDVKVGAYLPEEDKFVEEICYTSKTVTLRLSYERGHYPATSLILQYDDEVVVERE